MFKLKLPCDNIISRSTDVRKGFYTLTTRNLVDNAQYKDSWDGQTS